MNNIAKVYESSNLFELADNLKELIDVIQTKKSKNKILEKMFSQISWCREMDYFWSIPTKKYNIYQNVRATQVYLLNYWEFKNTYKENIICLSEIINTIQTNMLEPQKPQISGEMIDSLMNLADSRFQFIEKVLKSSILEILLLDHSHVELGSFYSASFYSDGQVIDRIIMTCLRHEIDCPHEFIFLHELGHVLHTRITKLPMTPPDSFKVVQKKMFPESLDYPKEKVAEIFADCFAIATLVGSELSQYNPYTFIEKEDNIFILAYMWELIQRAF